MPGHHMQVAIAQESPDIPMLRRRGGYSDFCEGRALSYRIGHMQWVKLRGAMKAKQGAAFDARQFHEILRAGSMPLVLLEREVMRRA